MAPEGTEVYAQGTHIHDSLKCPVCFEVLREPVMLKGGQACTHSFCRECLVKHLERTRNCPTCREAALDGGR